VTIGFQHSAPNVPRSDALLWRVTKDTRNAQSVVRVIPHGRELIVTVKGDLVWSRLFRPDEDVRELTRMADGCRVDFERVGWVRDVST
jgi:hypothetical protein